MFQQMEHLRCPLGAEVSERFFPFTKIHSGARVICLWVKTEVFKGLAKF